MQPPQSVEEVKATLETTEKGGVRQSIRNCLTVFQRDPVLAGAIAYNILTDRKDIIKPIGFHRESTALNDTDMKYLLLYLEETYGLTNEKKIDNAIGIVANENKYHPIRDYLSTLVWDGTERIRFCLRHFLGADADDYTYEALKLFLLGAISRAFQPGCKFEIMLCLVGGQGAGKSTFFRLLAVRDEWFSDDLRKLDDDNVYRKLQGHWIIEMSEMMATANAKSIEEIKSFLSRQKEVYKILIRHNPDGGFNLFLTGKPVGFLQIEKQILHVRIGQGCAFSVKTDGLYDVLAVGQDVVGDCPGKHRVTLEYGQAVPYALADTAFLGGFQSCLYFLNALGRLQGHLSPEEV